MKRAIPRESTFCAGLYRAIMDSAPVWEAREDINAAVRAAGFKEAFRLSVRALAERAFVAASATIA